MPHIFSQFKPGAFSQNSWKRPWYRNLKIFKSYRDTRFYLFDLPGIDGRYLKQKASESNAHHLHTVELWSLELACLEHQGSLELVRQSRQFPYTFNVKIHHSLEQRWLELSTSKHGPQGDFSCKNALMARTKYFFT